MLSLDDASCRRRSNSMRGRGWRLNTSAYFKRIARWNLAGHGLYYRLIDIRNHYRER